MEFQSQPRNASFLAAVLCLGLFTASCGESTEDRRVEPPTAYEKKEREFFVGVWHETYAPEVMWTLRPDGKFLCVAEASAVHRDSEELRGTWEWDDGFVRGRLVEVNGRPAEYQVPIVVYAVDRVGVRVALWSQDSEPTEVPLSRTATEDGRK